MKLNFKLFLVSVVMINFIFSVGEEVKSLLVDTFFEPNLSSWKYFDSVYKKIGCVEDHEIVSGNHLNDCYFDFLNYCLKDGRFKSEFKKSIQAKGIENEKIEETFSSIITKVKNNIKNSLDNKEKEIFISFFQDMPNNKEIEKKMHGILFDYFTNKYENADLREKAIVDFFDGMFCIATEDYKKNILSYVSNKEDNFEANSIFGKSMTDIKLDLPKLIELSNHIDALKMKESLPFEEKIKDPIYRFITYKDEKALDELFSAFELTKDKGNFIDGLNNFIKSIHDNDVQAETVFQSLIAVIKERISVSQKSISLVNDGDAIRPIEAIGKNLDILQLKEEIKSFIIENVIKDLQKKNTDLVSKLDTLRAYCNKNFITKKFLFICLGAFTVINLGVNLLYNKLTTKKESLDYEENK